LYGKGVEELLYYDEIGNFVMAPQQRRGVRQGCALGMFLFCVTMEPVYTRLRAAMGDQDNLYAYCDDSYLIFEPDKLA
jgi:hypothetical protein